MGHLDLPASLLGPLVCWAHQSAVPSIQSYQSVCWAHQSCQSAGPINTLGTGDNVVSELYPRMTVILRREN